MTEPTANEGPTHQLCAILFADMVGYSSLPETDALSLKEEMLTQARSGVQAHSGRALKVIYAF